MPSHSITYSFVRLHIFSLSLSLALSCSLFLSLALSYAFASDQTFVSVTCMAVTLVCPENTIFNNFEKHIDADLEVHSKYNVILRQYIILRNILVPNVNRKLYCCVFCAQLFMSLIAGIGQYFLSLLNSYLFGMWMCPCIY